LQNHLCQEGGRFCREGEEGECLRKKQLAYEPGKRRKKNWSRLSVVMKGKKGNKEGESGPRGLDGEEAEDKRVSLSGPTLDRRADGSTFLHGPQRN